MSSFELAQFITGEGVRDHAESRRQCVLSFARNRRFRSRIECTVAVTVLLAVRTAGVMRDGRSYDQVLALRAVTSVDSMAADFLPLRHGLPRLRLDSHPRPGEGDQPRDL